MVVDKIRVSIGSASVLGLSETSFKVAPTNCYIMTYKQGHCSANCGFCPQARESFSSTEKLSRVSWPVYPLKEFLTKLKYVSPLKRFKRICIQTLNYPQNFEDLQVLVPQIKNNSNIPISAAIPPMTKDQLQRLKFLGVERVGIALDGATEEIFNKIKGIQVQGPYKWDLHFKALKDALDIFPKGFVSTHVIIGLGESEQEVVSLINQLNEQNILVALFAFMPIKGTKFGELSQPDIINFRKIQLARHLITSMGKSLKDFTFNSKGSIINININQTQLKNIIEQTPAFLTTGCPGCNRPFYTSRPSGPTYNFPKELDEREKEEVFNQLKKFVKP